MRRFTLSLLVLLCGGILAFAQPRAIGMRTGVTGFDVSYQHSIGKNFIQADASTDFGYIASGAPGFKATGIYNFVFARPAWTDRGTWGIYAGPGISLGYVQDRVTYTESDVRLGLLDYGFMLSLTAQIGLEYTFWFPLQLSVDLRPYFGMHINDGIKYSIDSDTEVIRYSGKVGYYGNGWLGFAPTISVRYRF